MKQYVRLFELKTSQFTQDMAYVITSDGGKPYTRQQLGKKQVYPSQKFGERIGLRVWHDWNMPYDWDSDRTFRVFTANHDVFQTTKDEHLKDECFRHIAEISNELIRKNPELRGIPNYNRHMNDVLHGMVSKFNLDDIDVFIRMIDAGKIAGSELKKDPAYSSLLEAIERMLDSIFPNERVRLGWVASYGTLVRIKKRLDQIEKQR